MSGAKNEFHLSCGCHNRVADPFIAKAAEKVAEIAEAEKRAAEAETFATPNGAMIFTVSEKAVIRPVTGGDGAATVEALGIVGNKVVAAGDMATVEPAVTAYVAEHMTGTPVTTRTLTGTQTLIPGMIDAHMHLVSTALTMGWEDYTPFGDTAIDAPEQSPVMASQILRPSYDRAGLMRRMAKDVAKVKEGCWLLGTGVDTSLLGGRPFPEGTTLLNYIDATVLDGISETTPILVTAASGHTVYVNTPALREIWSNAEKQASEGNQRYQDMVKKYGSYDAYAAQTNGVLQEVAEMIPAVEAIGLEQKLQVIADLNDHLQAYLSLALSRGITMLYDASTSPEMYKLLLALLLWHAAKGERVPNRIGMAYAAEKLSDLDRLGSFAPPTENKGNRPGSIDLYFGTVKLVSDGSNQGLTGYQHDAYCCPPGSNYGIFNYLDGGAQQHTQPEASPPEGFVDLVKGIHDKGWPAMIHANGDQAIQYTLSAYATVAAADPSAKTRRNRIEHCSLLNADRLAEIKDLGVSPSFLIGHVGFWGWAFDDYIFKAKADECLDLCRSTADAEIPFTLHSDCPVSPLGPLRKMEQSITRKMEGSPEAMSGAPVADIPVLNAAERLTPAQALRAMTFDAAWQCHADHLVGSLEPGKLADFVILGQDPVSMDEDSAYMAMRNIPVEQVWIGGEDVTVA